MPSIPGWCSLSLFIYLFIHSFIYLWIRSRLLIVVNSWSYIISISFRTAYWPVLLHPGSVQSVLLPWWSSCTWPYWIASFFPQSSPLQKQTLPGEPADAVSINSIESSTALLTWALLPWLLRTAGRKRLEEQLCFSLRIPWLLDMRLMAGASPVSAHL